jgi:hypothetical protein
MTARERGRRMRATDRQATTRRGLRLRERLRERLHRRRVAWTAALVAVALAVGGAVALSPAASAASRGAGFGTWSATSAHGWHGSMLIDGVWTFCISPGLPAPVGDSRDAGVTAAVDGLSAAQLTRINLLVSTYGQTSDPVRAAAVAWAVKAIADWRRTLGEYGYRGDSLAGAVNWTFSSLSPANNAAIQRLAVAYYREAAATPAGTVAGSGRLVFAIDPRNAYAGTMRVEAPAGTSGTVTLTHGRFADNGTNRMAGIAAGRSYRVIGVPPSADGAPYRISGTGRFGRGYAAAVHLYRTPGQQDTAGPGGSAAIVVAGADAGTRTVAFRPVLTSRTASVSPTGALADTLSFGIAAGPDGLANPWFRRPDGTRVDVHFTVTAYGPLDHRPRESAQPPADAPVAETVRVDTGKAGDTAAVTATFTRLHSGGAYTFVAAYDPVATPAATRALLPGGYRWSHAFGMADETTVVPMRVGLTSTIADATTALSATDDDTVTVTHSGPWLRDDQGEPIAVVLRGEYVQYASGVASAATAALPPGSRVLGQTTLTVRGDGDYRASTGGALPRNPAAPVDPGASGGGVGWRWSIVASDQPAAQRGWVAETAEQYGVATQTAALAVPSVATAAQAGYAPGGRVKDVATVGGPLPAGGADLSFAAYAVPLVRGSDGTWTTDAPAGARSGDLSWVCTPGNLVFTDAGHGRRVTEPGVYAGPPATVAHAGRIVWVASLTVPGVAGSPESVVRRGACGEAEETSYGVAVTTRARAADGGGVAMPGTAVSDTAEATGYVPDGAAVSFAVYAWPTGGTPRCDRTTLQTTLRATSPLPPGFHPSGTPATVASASWTVPASAVGRTLGFVETLVDGLGRVVSVGACGAKTEVLEVHGPSVNTGGTGVDDGGRGHAPVLTVLGVLAVATAGVAAAALRVRRRTDAASTRAARG